LLDPGEIVQSQSVQSPDGRFRITLYGSGAQQTLAARFVSSSFRASFQPIALATDDFLDRGTHACAQARDPADRGQLL
jgi:3-dehydroshikimate dehydratase